MLAPDLLFWLVQVCAIYDVPPALPLAVMRMESGPHFKCGPLGKRGQFIGPGGIDKSFRVKWNIDDPKENIRLVVAAFAGKKTEAQIVKRIKKYNPKWKENNYLRDVLICYRSYQGIQGRSDPRRRP